ncbi:hypothetical protein CDD80_4703 [Ophiocordyceps camponoti-rufipedis]|uniref:Zn(2)-C6 fungal-type domain-containing protein n=1 Tax=Ophiocordyceps camponoti-rufipedis TaxID=2004952 RepID=A0A2C5ZHJ0_9HYPO|nr:hypothetical protein CDD80_4703 [Ophiocordyceps camponoti-rufipedis]
MFGTWKYDPETDEVQNLRRAYDPITARSNQHQACDRCHEKKLKCSGDKTGCDRCATSGHQCIYKRPRSRSSRKGNKPDHDTMETTRQEISSPRRRPSSRPRGLAARVPCSTPTRPSSQSSNSRDAPSRSTGLPVANQQHVSGSPGLVGGYGSSPALHLFPSQHLAPGPQDWSAAGQYAPLDVACLATATPMYGDVVPYDLFASFDDCQSLDPRYWNPTFP